MKNIVFAALACLALSACEQSSHTSNKKTEKTETPNATMTTTTTTDRTVKQPDASTIKTEDRVIRTQETKMKDDASMRPEDRLKVTTTPAPTVTTTPR